MKTGARLPPVTADPTTRTPRQPIAPLRPALVHALRTYDRTRLARDVVAGVVVGVVAIPLSLAFAIASGATPAAGLVTAIVGGVLVGVLGGSRFQVSGPTGAFIVVVAGVVAEFGLGGLLVATMLAGLILVALGLARLGKAVRFIPYPVIVGFTAGIGAIILLSQLPEVLGLPRAGLDAPVWERLVDLAGQLGATDPWAVALAAGTVGIVLSFKRWLPRVPGPVVALALLTLAANLLALPVETVGDRFGAFPRSLPTPRLPTMELALVRAVLPAALTIALLGAIESLLSAVVADGMTGDRHDPDQELVAQGVANLASPLVGGIPVTGAIARTATNIQAGATSPVSAIVHGLTILVLALVLAATVESIPLAVLAGILVVVAYNMLDLEALRQVTRLPRADGLVLATTFLLTVFVDLVVAVEVGMVLAALLFMARMARVAHVGELVPGSEEGEGQQSLAGKEVPPGVLVYSIDGPFFFGAAHEFQRTLERVAEPPAVLVLRMRHVPYMDATGLAALEAVLNHFERRGTTVVLSALRGQPLELLLSSGLVGRLGDANLQPNIDAALDRARAVLGVAPPESPGPGAPQPS